SQGDLAPCFQDAEGKTFDEFLHVIEGKTTGALRASIGLVTTFADVYAYMRFACQFIDKSLDKIKVGNLATNQKAIASESKPNVAGIFRKTQTLWWKRSQR